MAPQLGSLMNTHDAKQLLREAICQITMAVVVDSTILFS